MNVTFHNKKYQKIPTYSYRRNMYVSAATKKSIIEFVQLNARMMKNLANGMQDDVMRKLSDKKM